MISAAKSRASGSSVGKNSTMQSQSFSSCQYGSKSSLRFVFKIARSPSLFTLPTLKLAVQGRYNQSLHLGVSSRSLQGIAERPLPCSYYVVVSFTAVTRVQIPSGTPNLFRSLRGTATFGAGTKRHNSVANFWPGLPNRECFRASGAVLVGTKRHMQFSQISGRNRGCAKQANDPTLSSSFVDCNRSSVRIQCDSAGSMTQQLLHYLDICFSGRQQGRIRVPQRVPSDVLYDSDLHCSGADKTPHDCLPPIRFFFRPIRRSPAPAPFCLPEDRKSTRLNSSHSSI